MRPLLDTRLVDPAAGEPGLVVGFRDERRSLLFDLGELAMLPPRVLLRVSHGFVTHTHMDHFAGFDHLLSVSLGRVSRLVLWGGPDFVAQVEHKLRAYTWNVIHRYELALVLEVHEVRPEGGRCAAVFHSSQGFRRDSADLVDAPCGDDVLHDEAVFRVRAVFVDHEMPVLAYALEEKARLRVAPDRLAAMGLTTGAWLAELKKAVLRGASGDTPIALRWRDRMGEHEDVRSVAELSPLVLDVVAGRRIGYVTDLRHSEDNIARLRALLQDVDLLYIESVFLERDRHHAERKNHLTARQAGGIARRLGARRVVPFHFSPRYQGRQDELVAEVMDAWRGP